MIFGRIESRPQGVGSGNYAGTGSAATERSPGAAEKHRAETAG